MKKYWYAVQENNSDGWGYGSESLEEAKKMAAELAENAYIAVIDVTDDDPMCVAEIQQAEFDEYKGEWTEPEHWQFWWRCGI